MESLPVYPGHNAPPNLRIIEDLAEKGWSVQEDYLPADLSAALLSDLREQDRAERLSGAGVGRADQHRLRASIRNDRTLWLSRKATAVQGEYLDLMEELRTEINRAFFLGLFEYEAHYALYPEGGFYKKHVDALRGEKNRVVTTVCYLNPEWDEADGGKLVIYAPEGTEELGRVLPRRGTLVVFLSEEIPHEVLPAKRERCSIAGWFRCNASTGGRVDPPR